MANQNVEDLVQLRAAIVDYRRAAAQRGKQGDFIAASDAIAEMQLRIEAIDRAIADEKKIEGPPPVSFGTISRA
ncbi:hypothetical protein MRS76_19305 [Rhizobiaceae bacterium n13]|uniref:hypothetical protein n=1 Tax=Ferirhizobium litorale TaxID=2927786 RepID=UPI0024B30D62|nr:hypothetical protein [Fererhizobium litorale]MDI7864100.1 hypothetical protein [Fererhizobium litorale]